MVLLENVSTLMTEKKKNDKGRTTAKCGPEKTIFLHILRRANVRMLYPNISLCGSPEIKSYCIFREFSKSRFFFGSKFYLAFKFPRLNFNLNDIRSQ